MNKIIKKLVYAVGIIVLLCLGYGTGVHVEHKNQKNYENQKESISAIAVVNMDEGITINDSSVNYASQLIYLPNEHFTMTGLNDAKLGIENGSYAAYIVIPEQFSTFVTSLENNPQKVKIEYKFNSKLNEDAKIQAINDINRFISSLNSNIAYMYINSILTEFHQVQDNSAMVIKNDNEELKQLQNVDATQLIAFAEPVEETVVNMDVQPVGLETYINQNAEYLDALTADYEIAVNKGKDEYANIQEKHTEVDKASGEFFTLYDTVINDIEVNQNKLLDVGQQNLMEAVGVYNDNLDNVINTDDMAEKIFGLIVKQKEADENAAEELVEEKKTELNELQQNWEESIVLLENNLKVKMNIDSSEDNYYIYDFGDYKQNVLLGVYNKGVEDAKKQLIEEFQKETEAATPGDASVEVKDSYTTQEIENIIKKLELSEEESLETIDEMVFEVDVLKMVSIDWDSCGVTYPTSTPSDAEENDNGDSEESGGDEKDDNTVTFELCGEANEAAVKAALDSCVGDSSLSYDKEKIRELVKSDFGTALLDENKTQRARLLESKNSLNQSMSIYEKSLVDFNPLRHVEGANLKQYLDSIQVNTEKMMGAVEDNNAEYISYAVDVYAATANNTGNLREALNAANMQTKSNVESCMSNLLISRESVNTQNIDMLEDFAGLLPYTRVGSLGNVKVYDYIVNPVIPQNTGEIVDVQSAEKSKSQISLWKIVIIILGIGIVISLIWVISSLRRQRVRQQRQDT